MLNKHWLFGGVNSDFTGHKWLDAWRCKSCSLCCKCHGSHAHLDGHIKVAALLQELHGDVLVVLAPSGLLCGPVVAAAPIPGPHAHWLLHCCCLCTPQQDVSQSVAEPFAALHGLQQQPSLALRMSTDELVSCI